MGGVGFLRPFLQNLCFNSPWNYAVFWKLRAQHENVLAWEDGFCNIQQLKIPTDDKIEDFYSTEILHSDFSPYLLSKNPCNYTVGLAVAEMSHTSHVIGNGVVGEVALTRKPRWIYAAQIAADTSKTILSQYPDEWLLQISAGIKTILLFPVIPHGVLQLGSIEMVAEDAAILSCVENVLACCDDSGLPDWRYLIRELPLMFTVDDPASFIKTENTVMDEVASSHAANQSMAENMVHDFCNPTEQQSAMSLENGIAFGVSSEHTIPSDGPYQLSPSDYQDDVLSYFQHDEMLQASLYSEDIINWNGMQGGGGFVNLLEDLSFSEQSLVVLNDDAIYDTGINGLFGDVALTSHGGIIRKPEPETVGVNKSEKEALFETADASCSLDESSSSRSCVTSFKFEAKPLIGLKRRHHCPSVLKPVLKSEFVAPACLSPLASSVESKNMITVSPGNQQQRKNYHHSVNRGRVSRLSRSNKRKDCSSSSDNQRPRPRDRQLIQDRIKELRELVPNSEKCSIDGLLDRTIKHMLFLRNVSDQADKLRKHEADKMIGGEFNESGASWAVELGSSSSDRQTCPIVVKDLDQPGQMLIEMLCSDHGRFLEIANAIHRLQLTVLHGVMEKSSPRDSWARFIVETSGSFHRLDIFWPLMQLLQQNRMAKI